MTISTTGNNRDSYTTNGSTTAFAVSFPFLAITGSTHALKVIKVTVADGTEATLTENSDYTVAQTSGDPSVGTVTISPALATGFKLYILPELAVDQQVDLQNSTTIDMPTIEKAFDKLTLINQAQDERLTRAVILAETTDVTGITFPAVSAANASKFIKINVAGTDLEATAVAPGEFDISALTSSTALIGTDNLPGYDISTTSQVKSTINDIVEAGLLGLTAISDGDKDTIKTNLGIASGGGFEGTLVSSKFTTVSAAQSVSTVAGQWTAITGLTVTYTPTTETSKILLTAMVPLENSSATMDTMIRFTVDGRPLSTGDDPTMIGNAYDTMGIQGFIRTGTSIMQHNNLHHIVYTPGSTVSQTFGMEVMSPTASQTIKIHSGTNDQVYYTNQVSHLTLIEVK